MIQVQLYRKINKACEQLSCLNVTFHDKELNLFWDKVLKNAIFAGSQVFPSMFATGMS